MSDHPGPWVTLLGADGSWGFRGFLIRSGEPKRATPEVIRHAEEYQRQGGTLLILTDTPPPLRQRTPRGPLGRTMLDGGWEVAVEEAPPREGDESASATSNVVQCPACERTFPSLAATRRHAEVEHALTLAR